MLLCLRIEEISEQNYHDTVEAHSCVDDSYTDTRFLSKTQLVKIDQMQDVSTWRPLSTAYTGIILYEVETSCI